MFLFIPSYGVTNTHLHARVCSGCLLDSCPLFNAWKDPDEAWHLLEGLKTLRVMLALPPWRNAWRERGELRRFSTLHTLSSFFS